MRKIGLLILAVFIVGPFAGAVDSDRDAVEQAVLDYVDGIYLVQPDRIARSVSRELSKVGYRRSEESKEYKEYWMTYDELFELAGSWNKNGRVDPETALKKIEILDLLDQTATVKLTAHWGVDYMHLAKLNGRWMIMNVIWQGHPPNHH